MIIKHFGKYYTESYFNNLKMYGPPPLKPEFAAIALPTPPPKTFH